MKKIPIIGGVIVILLFIMLIFKSIADSSSRNNGYCETCGQEYETTGYVFNGNSCTEYRCRNCDVHGRIMDVFK